jgi:preprotein translocase subunit YajC
LIIVALFAVLWFVMIRPQRAKAQQQQRMLGAVEPGDEILTVGGIYGIVQELEPDEDGGDLIVEIADGIHVRIARKALAMVVKPDDDEDDEDDEGDAGEEADGAGDAPADAEPSARVDGVDDEGGTVNPGSPDQAPASDRS